MSTCKSGNYWPRLLAFLELKHSHLHIVFILNIKAEKTSQHFNASLFVNIWVAVTGYFLTIDARIGLVMKRGILQNTGPCLQAHYSSLGPARGLCGHRIGINLLTTSVNWITPPKMFLHSFGVNSLQLWGHRFGVNLHHQRCFGVKHLSLLLCEHQLGVNLHYE
jgi:hypothetical protein